MRVREAWCMLANDLKTTATVTYSAIASLLQVLHAVRRGGEHCPLAVNHTPGGSNQLHTRPQRTLQRI